MKAWILLARGREAFLDRFASRGHQNVENLTRAGNFPHTKRSKQFNRFHCVATTHRYEPVDNHNT
jgi:hypothetical protein